ncbi:MAG: hypothetical protein OXB96_02660 [Candidatus Kaiserbacteria bacterium]|nr:hypothetical protein [Candidatus Kaiserbacteria bacterium]
MQTDFSLTIRESTSPPPPPDSSSPTTETPQRQTKWRGGHLFPEKRTFSPIPPFPSETGDDPPPPDSFPLTFESPSPVGQSSLEEDQVQPTTVHRPTDQESVDGSDADQEVSAVTDVLAPKSQSDDSDPDAPTILLQSTPLIPTVAPGPDNPMDIALTFLSDRTSMRTMISLPNLVLPSVSAPMSFLSSFFSFLSVAFLLFQ